MTARILEAGGIPTVIIGSAYDIVTHCGVPRFLFNDLPLGNPVGRPWDRAMQKQSVEAAFALLETATSATLERTMFHWAEDDRWKENYMKIDDSNRDALRRMGEENRRRRRQQIQQGLRRD